MTGHWTNSYVGLPWLERGLTRQGIACWGIVHLAYREQKGIVVPDYSEGVQSVAERARIAAIFADATARGPWVGVDAASTRDFDVLVFRRGGMDMHVGLRCDPNRMLHISSGETSSIVRYDTGAWMHRLSAIYRHEDLV